MTVSINGSGDVKLQQIESKECIASIAGSGDIGLSGKTLNAEYKIAGSGNIGADKLKSKMYQPVQPAPAVSVATPPEN